MVHFIMFKRVLVLVTDSDGGTGCQLTFHFHLFTIFKIRAMQNTDGTALSPPHDLPTFAAELIEMVDLP